MKKARVSSQYLPVFCRELHQLVRAGIPIGEGLGMLREDEPDQAQRVWLDALYKDMEEGMPLSDALRQTEAFPSYMTDMVSMAEETGRLEDVLLSLSRHYDRQLRMSADIRGAIMVPMTLLVVMVAVVILLITQVLPVFDRVFAQLGVRMGGVATGMMNAGTVLARAGTGIGAAVVIITVIGVVIAAVPSLREKFAGWFNRSFGGRGVLGQIAVARFASAMAMAVNSGLTMDDSVALAGKLCGGAKEIDEKTTKCKKDIESGGSAADALASSGLFAGRDCRLLKLAEQTGSLPDTLEDLAVRQEEAGLRRLDQMVGAIEPAIVVITSALAGVILVSVMLPLMSLLSTIG